MGHNRLYPSSRLFEADWLAPRLAPFASFRVASVVPGGFPAYVRILHPAYGAKGARLRWAEVAVNSGRTMHRLVQFHAINRPPVSGPTVAVTPPDPGNLPADLLRVACAALAEHTKTEDRCWFCLWNGYGWLHDTTSSHIEFRPTGAFTPPPSTLNDTPDPALLPLHGPTALQNVPCVHLPQRDYILLEGPLDAATELGWNTDGGFVPQSPNLFWPDDHAWCVASEIDLSCTLVAGSNTLADSLLDDPRLEAWRVFPDDPVTADSDDKNT